MSFDIGLSKGRMEVYQSILDKKDDEEVRKLLIKESSNYKAKVYNSSINSFIYFSIIGSLVISSLILLPTLFKEKNKKEETLTSESS